MAAPAQWLQSECPAAANAAEQRSTCAPDASPAGPLHEAGGTCRPSVKKGVLPAGSIPRATPALTADGMLSDDDHADAAPDVASQYAAFGSLAERNSISEAAGAGVASTLAAFGSPVHIYEQCPQPPCAAATADPAAGWWCQRGECAGEAPRDGGRDGKPRWRGATGLPRPSAALAGDKENAGTPTPSLQARLITTDRSSCNLVLWFCIMISICLASFISHKSCNVIPCREHTSSLLWDESQARKNVARPHSKGRLPSAPQGSDGFFTPSPMGLGFMVEGIDSGSAMGGGTPRIVGLANSVTKFHEDRLVSMHLTPFTERCGRLRQPQLERDRALVPCCSGGAGMRHARRVVRTRLWKRIPAVMRACDRAGAALIACGLAA